MGGEQEGLSLTWPNAYGAQNPLKGLCVAEALLSSPIMKTSSKRRALDCLPAQHFRVAGQQESLLNELIESLARFPPIILDGSIHIPEFWLRRKLAQSLL